MAELTPNYNNKICAVILNYQSFEDTLNCVTNILEQQDVDVRIVIVDNCSPNGSFEILSAHFLSNQAVTVLKSEKNGGYAYGNNVGIKFLANADTEYIVICNNDICIGDKLLFSKIIESYKNLYKPAFVSPCMYVNGVKSIYSAWKIPTLKDDLIGSLRCLEGLWGSQTMYEQIPDKEFVAVDCIPGSFIFAEKNIYFDLGLMDEGTFLYMEEVILAYKAKEHNLQNYLLPRLKYEHSVSKTISSELSLSKMRSYLIDSKIYFHKTYLKTHAMGLMALRALFVFWKLETKIYRFLKSKNNK